MWNQVSWECADGPSSSSPVDRQITSYIINRHCIPKNLLHKWLYGHISELTRSRLISVLWPVWQHRVVLVAMALFARSAPICLSIMGSTVILDNGNCETYLHGHWRILQGKWTSDLELLHNPWTLLLCCKGDSFWVIVVDLPKALMKLQTASVMLITILILAEGNCSWNCVGWHHYMWTWHITWTQHDSP